MMQYRCLLGLTSIVWMLTWRRSAPFCDLSYNPFIRVLYPRQANNVNLENLLESEDEMVEDAVGDLEAQTIDAYQPVLNKELQPETEPPLAHITHIAVSEALRRTYVYINIHHHPCWYSPGYFDLNTHTHTRLTSCVCRSYLSIIKYPTDTYRLPWHNWACRPTITALTQLNRRNWICWRVIPTLV